MFHGAQNIIQEQAEDFTRNMQKKKSWSDFIVYVYVANFKQI